MKRKIRARQARLFDVPRLLEIDSEIWPNFSATEEMFCLRIKTFPEGQFVTEIDGKITGSVFSQMVRYEDWSSKDFTWEEITDCGKIRRTHNQNGNSVYGVGLAVAKEFQGTIASRLLISKIVQLAIRLNCQYVLLGSRIPSYHKNSDISPSLYIKTCRGKRLLDPELSLYKKYGGEPVRLLPNYMPDPESLNYGVLIKWQNPFYNRPFKKVIASFIDRTSRYL
jgi:hypothetical protein